MKHDSSDADALRRPVRPAAEEQPHLSNPASTGGAGTHFEQHVGAYWLAQLLVRGIPPILIDTVVTEISFQTERLGWHTDDFLVVCSRTGAALQRLVVQAKRAFTVSAADEDCTKAIADFWKDFNGPQFSKEDDRLVLVTRRGTNALLQHFTGLLDCARASHDGVDFEQRLGTNGFISDRAVAYCGVLQKIIGDIECRSVSAALLWPFLRALHVLSLDLSSSTSQAEAQAKTLLAYTIAEGDAAAFAAASWNELVGIASTAMSEARTVRREDLPPSMRARHSPIGTSEQRILQALKDHTAFTLGTIRSTLGTAFHLQRGALTQSVLEALAEVQVVVVAGPAGCGKSAVAKDSLSLISPDYFTFAFRVEEFAEAHLDRTLSASSIPANAAALTAILAGQGRKVIQVESVERLLEKTTRDAFSDLMMLARGDPALGIILTCRDYSVEQVRASFLEPAGVAHTVIRVPPLDDAELGHVEAALPALAVPLKRPALRNILRNPFFLDKALRVTWSQDERIPDSERDLRALFWREIVRADHRVPAGMGRRREETLQEIAVRRARALSAYVVSSDLDPAVLESLRRDSLIASPESGSLLVATAHDVLEDWAILQWIEEQHLTSAGMFEALAEAIGGHPAVRRSYRRWVAELIERDSAAAGSLFQAAISQRSISIQFRDDTLVSLLKAPTAPAFLVRHETQLLSNERTILKRMIHLLRVACVTTPPWFKGARPLFNVPDGPAWAAVLEIVQRDMPQFPDAERLLLLGLIEDWGRGVSAWTAYPKGAIAAGAIAHWLLPQYGTYRDDGPGQRILKTIAKIPKADAKRFEAVLRGTTGEREADRTAHDFQNIVFAGMEGAPAARDLPDLIASVAKEYVLCTEEELRHEYRGSTVGVELYFGVKEELHHGHFPASGYRGPWLPLLRHHPDRGIDLLISVFNHSADWYAHPRIYDRLEPAGVLTLTFEDGTSRNQWVNGRLWNLYRGTSVAPCVLQSMAMALERWLFELADSQPDILDTTLLGMLRRSDSGVLTAVAASVATAFPHAAGETLLVLLRAFELIRLDAYRVVGESQAPSVIANLYPLSRGSDELFGQERKQSDGLPHRKVDLEAAILKLQFGPLAKRVHQILDVHCAALPPEGRRTEADKVRLLALRRMDLRQYSIREHVDSTPAETPLAEPSRAWLRLEPKQQDTDVQQMVDQSAARLAETNARIALLMWGLKVFSYEQTPGIDPTQWRDRLQQARNLNISDLDPAEMAASGSGPSVVAAVCVRDHWVEMSSDERGWCAERVCAEIMGDADTWDQTTRIQRNSMSADRSCGSVISLLIGKELTLDQHAAVREAFINALTHPITEVQWYAVWGIARQLWSIDPALTIRSVDALAYAGTLVDEARAIEKSKRYDERRRTEDIEAETAALIRQRFWTGGAIPADAKDRLDLDDWFGAEATARILAIFGQVPNDSLAVAAYARSAAKLTEWWDEHDDRSDDRPRKQRSDQAGITVSELIRTFLLNANREAAETILKPLLDAVDRAPRDLHWFLRGLVLAEDQQSKTGQFWFVWNRFAERVRRAPWVKRLEDRHSTGQEVISAVFLGAFWKDDVRHWRSLDGHIGDVDTLFDDLPPSSTVFDAYVRFLYHIGERSLPQAFVRICRKLQAGSPRQMLREGNTVFMLAALLQRHVYGRPFELKRDPVVRQGVLDLLDTLVEIGSSAAFRMRDDFVTPAA